MRNEQRLFYRIDAMVPCSYHIVKDNDEEQSIPDNPDSSYIEQYFMKNLTQLDDQINEVIGQINVKSSLLASALAAMNNKINFMLQTIHPDQLTRAIPQRLVNLSGGGISFVINEPVNSDDKIDLLIHPIPTEKPILIRCDIVNITPLTKEKESYRISLKYQSLPEEERRKLVYFIQSKEIEVAQQERNPDSQ